MGKPILLNAAGLPLRMQDTAHKLEHIPFDETRNYVMRVIESLPIYRAQLAGQVAPLAFTDELTGRPGHVRQAVKGEFVRPRARPAALID